MEPTNPPTKNKKPIEFIKQIEEDTLNLTNILDEIKSNLDYSVFPSQLKEQLNAYQDKIGKYKDLLLQKNAIKDFYKTLKPEFGINDEVSFEKGMVSLVLEYQTNLEKVAEILVNMPESEVIRDQETYIFDNKIFTRKDYLTNASRIISLLETSCKQLIESNSHNNSSESELTPLEEKVDQLHQKVDDIQLSLTDKPEESVDNPINNPIDGSINASNQLNNDQLYDSEQPNDYDLDENNFNDQKKNHEKGHKGISGFKKVLLYGLGIVLLGGGAVGGWYLNNIYNPNKIEERVIASNCGDCNPGNLIFDEEGLITRINESLDDKNDELINVLGCKEDQNKDGKKDKKAKTEQKTNFKRKNEVTEIKFSELYKDKFNVGDETNVIFSIENVDHCQGKPLVDSRKLRIKLNCLESLCTINIPPSSPEGVHNLQVFCYDKELMKNSNKVSRTYQIELLPSKDKDKVKAKVVDISNKKWILKSLNHYDVKVGERYNGEFRLNVEGFDEIPQLKTTEINFRGGQFNVSKKNDDIKDGTYLVQSGVITHEEIKYPYRPTIEICFEDKDKLLCYAERMKIEAKVYRRNR
ncbi:hypothetical protein HOL59_06180 [Candidatus Woesearchaeota archaeon]|jgi:hypothetical protein|nr:hypothetical protein [Candidatus Woesearchaeota archaeon]